jgi:hypothetical protein
MRLSLLLQLSLGTDRFQAERGWAGVRACKRAISLAVERARVAMLTGAERRLAIDIPSGYGNAFHAKGDALPDFREVRAMWQHPHRWRKECVGETVFGPEWAGKHLPELSREAKYQDVISRSLL